MSKRITIDPCQYAGTYSIYRRSPLECVAESVQGSDGPASFELAATDHYISVAPGCNFTFSVTERGVSAPGTHGLSASGTRLSFVTNAIDVAPGRYRGRYQIQGVTDIGTGQQRRVHVLVGQNDDSSPNAGYILYVAPGNSFRFLVDDEGQPRPHKDYPGVGRFSRKTFHLNGSAIEIEPIDHAEEWYVLNVESRAAARKRHVTVIPGVTGYILQIRPSVNGRFDVDANGSPSPDVLSITDGAVVRRFHLKSCHA